MATKKNTCVGYRHTISGYCPECAESKRLKQKSIHKHCYHLVRIQKDYFANYSHLGKIGTTQWKYECCTCNRTRRIQ